MMIGKHRYAHIRAHTHARTQTHTHTWHNNTRTNDTETETSVKILSQTDSQTDRHQHDFQLPRALTVSHRLESEARSGFFDSPILIIDSCPAKLQHRLPYKQPPTWSMEACGFMCIRACACICVCVCVRVQVCVCVSVWCYARTLVSTFLTMSMHLICLLDSVEKLLLISRKTKRWEKTF